MKVAIVHDWLVVSGGAEKVLGCLIDLYPDADLYSMVDFLPEKSRGFLNGKSVRTSALQQFPGARKHYRHFLALMPMLVEQFDLSQYDLVITSSYAVAKGVMTGPDTLHVCYCHSPARYAWDLQHQYLRESKLETGAKSWLVRAMLHYFRIWDMRTANGVDAYIANSSFIARRIMKAYGREATVIWPPVDSDSFETSSTRENYYVTASRMVPYKRIDLLVEAFVSMPSRRFVVIGDGPDMEKIRRSAQGSSNIEFLGHVDHELLVKTISNSRAFLFGAEEDFGIVPVEAMAAGIPVIAYGKGGILDSVVPIPHPNATGTFFMEQTAESVIDSVQRFESAESQFDPERIREHALGFSSERFKSRLSSFIRQKQALRDTWAVPAAVRAMAEAAATYRQESEPSVAKDIRKVQVLPDSVTKV